MCLGIPAQIVEITNAERCLAKVTVSGIIREINIACVVDENHPIESCVGEWVLLHVGFAMGRIDELEAKRTIELLAELGEAQKEFEAMQNAPDTACGSSAST